MYTNCPHRIYVSCASQNIRRLEQMSSTSRRKPEITQTTISLGHINSLVFVISMATFYCAVRTGSSDKTE